MPEEIPISEAKALAELHDYDQIIILARSVGRQCWVTTYGTTKEGKHTAARIGQVLREDVTPRIDRMVDVLRECFEHVPEELQGKITQAIAHPPLQETKP